jgi:predicted SAM-dependent methyltransferase
MQKLHLGCGSKYLEGWTNVDIQSDRADLHADITNLKTIQDDSVSEIYACHVLEHISRRKLIPTLQEWWRVLCPGGNLRLAVPDFAAVVAVYSKTQDLSDLCGLLSGGQKDQHDFHTICLDHSMLEAILHSVGFKNVQKYDPHVFLKDMDDYSKCYLPHMDFKNGTLMSLNVVCKKSSADPPTVIDSRVQKFTKFEST